MNKIYIHANNVHQGGGRTLLLALLKSISVKYDWYATLDLRLRQSYDSCGSDRINWVAPSVLQRLFSEWRLSRLVYKGDVVLCFGNLPPLFRYCGRVIVFVQNRYLVESLSLQGNSLPVRLRIHIERWWLIWFAKNVDSFVVQTPTMKSLLQSRVTLSKAVFVLPFVGTNMGYTRNAPIRSGLVFKFDFLYVASGEPHKNHSSLIDAWCLLAKAGIFPSLCLTVDETAFPEVCQFLQGKKSAYDLNISNLGVVPHAQIQLLYGQVQALIYPSAFESLGLPLIEARQAGLPVLAPELDYVRDVLDPEQVFDPASPISIARAVKRFMGLEELPLPLLDASCFMNQLLQGTD